MKSYVKGTDVRKRSYMSQIIDNGANTAQVVNQYKSPKMTIESSGREGDGNSSANRSISHSHADRGAEDGGNRPQLEKFRLKVPKILDAQLPKGVGRIKRTRNAV